MSLESAFAGIAGLTSYFNLQTVFQLSQLLYTMAQVSEGR